MSESHPSVATYWIVFAALVVLLVLTVLAAELDLPEAWMRVTVAMVIAAAKALLIVLFFMHLWYRVPIIRLVAAAALVWGLIGAGLTLTDYFTRNWHEVDQPRVEVEMVDRVSAEGRRQAEAAREAPPSPEAGSIDPES